MILIRMGTKDALNLTNRCLVGCAEPANPFELRLFKALKLGYIHQRN